MLVHRTVCPFTIPTKQIDCIHRIRPIRKHDRPATNPSKALTWTIMWWKLAMALKHHYFHQNQDHGKNSSSSSSRRKSKAHCVLKWMEFPSHMNIELCNRRDQHQLLRRRQFKNGLNCTLHTLHEWLHLMVDNCDFVMNALKLIEHYYQDVYWFGQGYS